MAQILSPAEGQNRLSSYPPYHRYRSLRLRVSDAAPTIGVAAWWYGWSASDLDALAGALVAGHLIECSISVSGRYWGRFKDLMHEKRHLNLGFPIAKVHRDGARDITK